MVPVRTQTDVLARKDSVKRGFGPMHESWRELEDFRRMDSTRVSDAIWKNVSKQNQTWTIIKSDVAAIDLTTESFLVGDGFSVTAEPKDASSARLGDQANLLERLGMGVWNWLDDGRAVPLHHQLIKSAVNRGHLCIQYGWVGYKDRGEIRETVEPREAFNIPGLEELDQPRQRITTEGAPPVFVQVLDPIDCYWNLGKRDRVLEFVHEFRASYIQLCDIYPDLAEDDRFNAYRTANAYDTVLTVVDYWNEQVNAILVENHEYKKPTPHGYGRVPIVVELINPQLDRSAKDGTTVYWGTPFSLPVLEHVKALSWADSISATYMEEIAFALLQHKGIKTSGPRSPHIQINPQTKQAEYVAEFDFSPDARIKPMYDGETLEYLQPPRLVDMLQEFKSARMRDIQLMTYAEGILTGVYKLDLSGVSVAQQKQAAMARLAYYELGINRASSRMMTEIFALFPEEWDRIGPFLITLLVDNVQQEIPITREMFSAVRKVTVNLKPKIPINPEAELQFKLNALQMNVLPLRDVMEALGVQDPSSAMKQIAMERMIFQPGSPYMEAMARERMKELGFAPPPDPNALGPGTGMGPGPVAAGATPPPAPVPLPPPAAPPPTPVPGGAVPGPPMGGPQVPPELEQVVAMLQQTNPDLVPELLRAYQQDPERTMAMIQQLMQASGGGRPATPPPLAIGPQAGPAPQGVI